jgi:DNA invertase Pin-like site-specific DNA recombinase
MKTRHADPSISDNKPLAYSYVRFSTPEQANGDSLRRQTEAARKWCERNGARLDTSTTLHDLGKSAFRGAHHKDDRHALGTFIKLAESGRVPEGSFLIIERLDRLTREDVNDALELFLRLKKLVRIVQLYPVEVIHDRQSGPMQLMMALVELMRGRDESEAKSERGGAVWSRKREEARAAGKVMSRRLPAWIREESGVLRLIPQRAAAVRRIFELAAAGYGQGLIVKKLNEEQVPPFGEYVVKEGKKRSAYAGKWLRSYVAKLLRDRRAVGDLVPCSRGRTAEEPIANYYPAAISEDLWRAARAASTSRDRLPGRKRAGGGAFVHVFEGLLRDARDDGSFYLFYRGPKGAPARFVINAAGFERHKPIVTFPLNTLERAILSCLREIDPHEILNGDSGPDETVELGKQFAAVEVELAEAAAFMEAHGFSATIGKRITGLEVKKRDLAEQLATARQKAAHPLSEIWGEAQTLIAALDAAPDPKDARLRLRAALRRMVESIYLLIVPRGADRLCAAQVWFAGGRHRDYLVLSRPPKAGRCGWRVEGGYRAGSCADLAALGPRDLRRREDAKKVEYLLTVLDLAGLWDQLGEVK